MASSDPLFTPLSIGPIQLKHRIVLAPLTRIRAEVDSLAPNDLIGEYYEQRASDGGLIITEVGKSIQHRKLIVGNLPVSPCGRYGGYARTMYG